MAVPGIFLPFTGNLVDMDLKNFYISTPGLDGFVKIPHFIRGVFLADQLQAMDLVGFINDFLDGPFHDGRFKFRFFELLWQ